jgi:hypothetical protein
MATTLLSMLLYLPVAMLVTQSASTWAWGGPAHFGLSRWYVAYWASSICDPRLPSTHGFPNCGDALRIRSHARSRQLD